VTNYTWSFGDGLTVSVVGFSSARSRCHIYKKPGLYLVRVVAANSMGFAETSVQVWAQGALLSPFGYVSTDCSIRQKNMHTSIYGKITWYTLWYG